MKSFVEKDFSNGVQEETHFTSDGGMHQTFTQDITQLMDDNKNKRNSTSSWMKYDPKQNYHQVLDLSMTDVMRIKREHGVDLLGDNVDYKYLFKLIETHYPYMKTTTARL
tara:strand:- start:881 stop:1210 length:330 start_codon:yes stop_codon:yes gene_type:complete